MGFVARGGEAKPARRDPPATPRLLDLASAGRLAPKADIVAALLLAFAIVSSRSPNLCAVDSLDLSFRISRLRSRSISNEKVGEQMAGWMNWIDRSLYYKLGCGLRGHEVHVPHSHARRPPPVESTLEKGRHRDPLSRRLVHDARVHVVDNGDVCRGRQHREAEEGGGEQPRGQRELKVGQPNYGEETGRQAGTTRARWP